MVFRIWHGTESSDSSSRKITRSHIQTERARAQVREGERDGLCDVVWCIKHGVLYQGIFGMAFFLLLFCSFGIRLFVLKPF